MAVVGILGNGAKRTFVVDVVGVESVEELPVIQAGLGCRRTSRGTACTADMQWHGQLHRLKPAVGMWLIAAADPEATWVSGDCVNCAELAAGITKTDNELVAESISI